MDPLEDIARLRAAVEADPTDADALFALACRLREVEDYAAAAPYAEQAADIRDDFGAAAALAALCLHMAGHVERAWPWYERALAAGDADAVLLYNAGVAADALLRYEDAIALYRRALEHRPDYVEALNNLGIALAQAGHHAAAADILQALLEMANAPSRHLAHCNLGLVYHYLDRLEEAIASFQAAVLLEPAFAVAYCNLGNAYTAKGAFDLAADMYRMAIALDPNNVLAYNALGSLEHGAAAPPAAVVGEYEAYLDRRPWSALVYYNLALALAQRGNAGEALRHLENALRMEPRFREAQQAYDALRRSRPPGADA